jgi:16S rRNA (cytosine967-C5)-methyltransferase
LDDLEKEEAARLSTPEWLFESWEKEYGLKGAKDIAVAHLSEPSLDLTARQVPIALAEKLNANLLPTQSVRLDSAGNVTAIDGFTDGDWWVQDAAAALPARLVPKPSGKRVYDLCAAPGGKTAQLFSAGAKVIAVDRSEKRLEIMKRNLTRLGITIELHCADALSWQPKKLADAVLLDAPCSATGTVRRHPDITLLKSLSDVRRLAKLQLKLINAAAKLVRPGGHLVYAVCSLQPEECQRVVNKFLLTNEQFKRDPIASEEIYNVSEFITPAGDMRTLPSHWRALGGLDGFFAARIKRSSHS